MSKIKTGKIIKGIGGFYYVKIGDDIIECRARGKFRKDSVLPYVGDNVDIDIKEELGYVVKIHERKNCFIRPPVANVDKLLIVAALCNPEPDTLFIDKMLVCAHSHNVETAICFNKADLCDNYSHLIDTYKNAGYNVFVTSAKSQTGTEDLKSFIADSVTAVCGFSGVGKSSLLNLTANSDSFEVGEISQRLNRGKHTTRHVELFEIDKDTYIADTPGFSMLSLDKEINCTNLIEYFPDLHKYALDCRFSDCRHINNNCGCSLAEAYSNGLVSESRYNNYKYLLNTLKDNKEWKR